MKKLVLLGLVSLSLFANEADLYLNKAVKAYKHKNYSTALKYLKKSCDLGNAQCCGAVGECYFKGIGIGKDYKEALKYYKKTCDLGNAQGCDAVGECYFNGIGVGRDYKTASKYFKKACDKGFKGSCKNYKIAKEKNE